MQFLCYVLIYADDMLVTDPSFSPISNIIHKLNENFSLKHLDKPDYFLAIEVKYLNKCYMLLT